MRTRHRRPIAILSGVAFLVMTSVGCAFSQNIQISSEPSGARAWLGRNPVGQTPTQANARATGPIRGYTLDPEYVTVELDGYRREVRKLDYKWSARNVLLSIPFVLGIPGILLWAKLPTDIHVELEPE